MKRLTNLCSLFRVSVLPLLLLSMHPAVSHAGENIGTSCADCPNYSGAFSIENHTGVTIHYQYKWGDKHPWKEMVLNSGYSETHRYPLGEDRTAKVPTPYVRFDRIGGDGRYTPQEYRMEFYAVGYAGYGPAVNRTQPKHYYFQYGPDGRTLDLRASSH